MDYCTEDQTKLPEFGLTSSTSDTPFVLSMGAQEAILVYVQLEGSSERDQRED